jgi:hypothetical protein
MIMNNRVCQTHPHNSQQQQPYGRKKKRKKKRGKKGGRTWGFYKVSILSQKEEL